MIIDLHTSSFAYLLLDDVSDDPRDDAGHGDDADDGNDVDRRARGVIHHPLRIRCAAEAHFVAVLAAGADLPPLVSRRWRRWVEVAVHRSNKVGVSVLAVDVTVIVGCAIILWSEV